MLPEETAFMHCLFDYSSTTFQHSGLLQYAVLCYAIDRPGGLKDGLTDDYIVVNCPACVQKCRLVFLSYSSGEPFIVTTGIL